MIGVTRIIVCHRLALGILYIWFTVGKFPCNLGKLLIDHIRFLLITHLWIQIENSHYLCVTVFCSKFPCYLNDGTVYLDTKEVLGLSCYADCCLERYRSVNVRHGSSAHESIPIPGATAIPCKIESCLAILHDGWYAVVVISGYRFSFLRFLLCLLILTKLVLPAILL